MANMNKVILIGRLTRDPELRNFQNGGAVAKLGFAVSNRTKDKATGQWKDDPMFIDIEVYNRGENGKGATSAAENLSKGSQVCVEGRLALDQWEDKTTGAKRQKHKLIADYIHYLDPKGERTGGGADGGPSPDEATGAGPGDGEEIPF
jgi:single-strand DNA-binding protein